jgi:hypothetical protein
MDNMVILDALDALAMALLEHDHAWTQKERELYEKATKELNTNK